MDIDTQVCIAGGGAAGMMLGLILARQGLDVVVLEKHADFLRDFRGDTVHPSTMDILDELGLGSAVAQVPHRDVAHLQASFADGTYRVADFSRLKGAHPYIRFMPQWDFLTVLANEARTLPSFRLLMRHQVMKVRRAGAVVTGVDAVGPEGKVRVSAGLVVAADGRASIIREQSDLPVREFSAPMDVLWFRVSRGAGEREGLDMHFGPGRLMLGIDRGEYWQMAYVVPKGTAEQMYARDIGDLHRAATRLMPALGPRIGEVTSWEEVSTLTVRMHRLRRWYQPGLLCIGDAAHAMSPIGGVGINLAIQDAVAAGRMLDEALRAGPLTPRSLAAIQRRRELPTVVTQLVQRALQRLVIKPTLSSSNEIAAPVALRILSRFSRLQALPARLIGVGVRPEHLPPGR